TIQLRPIQLSSLHPFVRFRTLQRLRLPITARTTAIGPATETSAKVAASATVAASTAAQHTAQQEPQQTAATPTTRSATPSARKQEDQHEDKDHPANPDPNPVSSAVHAFPVVPVRLCRRIQRYAGVRCDRIANLLHPE